MRLERVRFRNFRTFLGEHKFVFPDATSGLFFITGTNEARKRMGGNGIGKTTFIDVVLWIIRGKTSRDQTGPAIKSWSGKGPTWGELSFEHRGEKHDIYRSQTPNALELDGKPCTQEQIDRLIGRPADLFTKSIYVPQFGQGFFQLRPADRLKMFTDMLHLNVWEAATKEAGSQSQTFRAEGVQLESELGSAKAMLREADDRLVSAEENLKAAEQEQADERAKTKKARAKINDEIDTLTAAKKKSIAAQKDGYTAIDALRPLIADGERKVSLIWGDLQKAQRKVDDAQVDEGRRKAALVRLDTMGAACSECGQPITRAHIAAERHRMERELKALLSDIEDYRRARDVVKKKHDKAVENGRRTRADLKVLEDALIDLRTKAAETEGALLGANMRLNDMKAAASGEVDRWRRTLEDCEIQVRKYDKKIRRLEDDISDCAGDAAGAELWISAFKRIRLEQIEESLAGLNVETANAMADLSLHDWKVTYSIERETQSGSVQRGFHVFIQSPDSPERVPWESWCGGETARLLIAGNAAMIATMSTGDTDKDGIGFEFWDEPTSFLSGPGVIDMLDLLRDRADSMRRQIWLIDHRTLDYGDFDGVLNVTRAKDGSKLEYRGLR